MKDFEKDLIYYPNPDPIEEPRFVLNSVDELEKSEKYSVICNGTRTCGIPYRFIRLCGSNKRQ